MGYDSDTFLIDNMTKNIHIKLNKYLVLLDPTETNQEIRDWMVYNIKNQSWSPLNDVIRKKSKHICVKYRDNWNNTKYYSIRDDRESNKAPYPFSGVIVSLPEFPVDKTSARSEKADRISKKKQWIEKYRNIPTILPCLSGNKYHILLCGSPPLLKGSIFYQFPNISLIVNTACPHSDKDKPALPNRYNSEHIYEGKINCDIVMIDIRRKRHQRDFFSKLMKIHLSIYRSLLKGDVVIHCLMGQHRSVFTLISYWIWLHIVKNIPYPFQNKDKPKRIIDSAYQYIIEYRPIVESRNFPSLLNRYIDYLMSISHN